MVSKVVAAVLFGATLVSANSAVLTTCTGYHLPNYDDCDSVIDFFGMSGNSSVFHENGEDNLPRPSCKWWFWEEGNCRITNCFIATDDNKRTGEMLASEYKEAHDACVSWRAGASMEYTGDTLDVWNDEDETRKRDLAPSLRNVQRSANGMVSGYSTLEEYKAIKERSTPPASKRAEEAIRQVGVALAAADGNEVKREDVNYQFEFNAIGIRKNDAVDRGPRLGKGVGYTYDTSESHTYSVSMSEEIGGAFEAFSIGMSLSISQEDSFTISEGLQFDVDCSNAGQVNFYPFYDYYNVYFTPANKWSEIWVPVDKGSRKINGEIVVDCLG